MNAQTLAAPSARTWRNLVAARDVALGPRDKSYWNGRSERYAVSLSGQDEPFMRVLAPWLRPDKTLIDVGAGVGRHSVPLARMLRHVTAVEPSPGMRAAIPPEPNLTVVSEPWPHALVPSADLVICVHSLYPIGDVVPFLQGLDLAATERVFVVMRDDASRHPAEILAGSMPEPLLRHLFGVLREMDIVPDVSLYRYRASYRFASLDAAVADTRQRAGSRWDDESGRAFLRERLRRTDDGLLEFDCGQMVAGVVQWTPTGCQE